jgi:hypothetical protein
MLNSLIGIIASSGGVAVSNSFESIATVNVTTAVTSISFTSIPTTYQHLQIRCLTRNQSGATASSMSVRFNSDTTNAYTSHLLVGDGTSATADGGTLFDKNYSQVTTGNNSASNVFAAQIIDVLDYDDTNKYKTIRAVSGFDDNSVGTIRLGSSLWTNTSAISSIQIFNYGGSNFLQYSTFALYGIKG